MNELEERFDGEEDDWEKSDHSNCTRYVQQNVRVQAIVDVTPRVFVEEPSIDCSDSRVYSKSHAKCHPNKSYTFTVEQDLCLTIPLTFGADVTVRRTGIICPTPSPDTNKPADRRSGAAPKLLINKKFAVPRVHSRKKQHRHRSHCK